MLFLRSFIFFLGQVVLTPIFTLLAILAWPLKPLPRNRLIAGWAKSILWWLKVTCNIRYEIKGLAHIPSQPCVILGKHQSAWETIAFQAFLPTQCYVLKKSLLWIPIFGWGLAMTSSIAINRAAGREALKQLTEQGKARLAAGLSVVVFPEGTRMAVGKRGKYHIGGAWLAAQTSAQILPVAHNAGKCWPKNGFIKRPGIIQVVIGAPIISEGRRADALNSQVETWIETEMQSL